MASIWHWCNMSVLPNTLQSTWFIGTIVDSVIVNYRWHTKRQATLQANEINRGVYLHIGNSSSSKSMMLRHKSATRVTQIRYPLSTALLNWHIHVGIMLYFNLVKILFSIYFLDTVISERTVWSMSITGNVANCCERNLSQHYPISLCFGFCYTWV